MKFRFNSRAYRATQSVSILAAGLTLAACGDDPGPTTSTDDDMTTQDDDGKSGSSMAGAGATDDGTGGKTGSNGTGGGGNTDGTGGGGTVVPACEASDAPRAGQTPCGDAGAGALEQTCEDGKWTDTSTCLTENLCDPGDTRSGATDCGLNDRGAIEQSCDDGSWKDTSTCVDPDDCEDDSARAGSAVGGAGRCGVNNSGFLNQVCTAGQWEDAITCVDPDTCKNGDTADGDSCGLNGSGTEVDTCTAGQWPATPVCVDPDVCTNTDTEPGTSDNGAATCGRNSAGYYQRVCGEGQWADSESCADPHDCTVGQRRNGASTCGPNGNGRRPVECTDGLWVNAMEDMSACVDFDVCQNDVEQEVAGGCASGLGTSYQTCRSGQWQEDDCQIPACSNGANADRSCGLNGMGLEPVACVGGDWESAGACDDADICVNDALSPGDACTGGLSSSRRCVDGQWGPTVCASPMIDDFDDLDSKILLVDGRNGGWDISNDGSGTQQLSYVADGERGDGVLMSSFENFSGWGAGVSYDFKRVADVSAVYDGEQYLGISFWARSTNEGIVHVRLNNLDTHPEGGLCDPAPVPAEGEGCYDAFGTSVYVTSEWSRYVVRWSDLAQSGWGQPIPTGFDASTLMTGTFQVDAGEDTEIRIDDLSFLVSECEDGEERQQVDGCGFNGSGTLYEACDRGTWVNQGCDDPDECLNFDEGSEECGLNGAGTEARVCTDGTWVGECVDPDECVNGVSEPDPSGSCSPGAQAIRFCDAGQWNSQCIGSPMIDDVEDGNVMLLPNDGRTGQWEAYDDGTSGATATMAATAGYDGSVGAMHLSASGFDGWGAGMKAQLMNDNSPYDARAYAGFSFWMRSTTGAPIVMRVADSSSEPGNGCIPDESCYASFETTLYPTGAWEKVTLRWSDFQRVDWAPLEWATLPDRENMHSISFESWAALELTIDDLSFVVAECVNGEEEAGSCPDTYYSRFCNAGLWEIISCDAPGTQFDNFDSNSTQVSSEFGDGYWFGIDDGTGTMSGTSFVQGQDGEDFGLAISGSGFTGWGAALVAQFYDGGLAAADLSAYEGFTFWVRDDSGGGYDLYAKLGDIQSVPAGGLCDVGVDCYAHLSSGGLPVTGSWQKYTVRFEDMTSSEFASLRSDVIYELQLQISGDTEGAAFDLQVDDVQFFSDP